MLESLKREIDTCELADRYRLRRKIRDLEKLQLGKSEHKNRIAALSKAIEKSQQACQVRAAAIPSNINYPSNLPVSEKAAEITDLISNNQVLVVTGDTGSGKTTQLPKICLQAGLGRWGLIGHTQPRRLAAVSVANRIAEELNTVPGEGVGYQVRFDEKLSDSTFLKLMTDGILLAEIQQDRYLNRYEVLIIDEAHERSLNIDFLLGFLNQLLDKRKDLKLIITSATIDVDKFAAHFNDAPIVSVTGRTYPVETRYLPLRANKEEQLDDDIQSNAIIDAVEEIVALDNKKGKRSGDILVFFSGEREIRETANKLRKRKFQNTEVLPLYSRLRHSEQLKIFKTHQGRRIVLATNVAETSLTVPGINYVIDTGFARISRYSLQSKVQRLPIEPISQASADQRKGRCGRLADGICIRLYSEDDYDSRPLFTDPEIKRTNLAAVILKMKYMRLGDAEEFPFLEPPAQNAINEGLKLLIELNALTSNRKLTDYGRKMAVFPVDPKYARMIIEANVQGCLQEILIIVSAMSIQDPRDISSENRQQALQALSEFNHPDSDFLGFVYLWNHYENRRQSQTQSQLKKYCRTHFLSFMRMREWREVHRQLLVTCQRLGFRINKNKAIEEAIHKCIIAGSLNQIACRVEGKTYIGSRNKKFSLYSSSAIGSQPAKWVVTGDLIETSQTFASLAAKIEPEWVEQMALHLVKREYFDPHWSKKKQQVMAYEKVILYGIVIIEKSPVAYRHIDPEACREIFIREALTEGQIVTGFDFYKHNCDFIASLNKQEDKIRKPDFMISDREVIHFYERRLAEEIYSTRDLEQWLDKELKRSPDLLKMDRSNLMESDTNMAKLDEFPDLAEVQQNRLTIDYVFSPGSKNDGASIEVPTALLNQLTQADMDWSVPGIIREKCIALLKALPKTLRKNFIPVSGFVDDILPRMSSADGELIDALIAQINNSKKLKIGREQFQNIELADHLRVKVRVVNEAGEEIAYGDDLQDIKRELKISLPDSEQLSQAANYNHELEVQGLTDWDIDTLPKQVEIGDELTLVRFPALVDCSDSVSVELFADEGEADRTMGPGLIRLYMFRSIQQRNQLRKQFARFVDKHALEISGYLKSVAEDAILASYAAAFEVDKNIPRCRSDFEETLQQGKSRILSVGDKVESLLIHTVEQRLVISRQLNGISGQELDYLRVDIEQQLSNLIHTGFLYEDGLQRLAEYPRYFEAIKLRLDRAPHMGDKDKNHTDLITNYWRRYQDWVNSDRPVDIAALQSMRWMIEEFRVSLFAQSLGTRIAVSPKRLDKQLDKIAESYN